MEKKKLINEGKLDKYGRINENTPASWKKSFVDLSEIGTKNDPGTSSSITVPPTSLISTTPSAPVEDLKIADEGASSSKKVCVNIFFLKYFQRLNLINVIILHRGKLRKILIFLRLK